MFFNFKGTSKSHNIQVAALQFCRLHPTLSFMLHIWSDFSTTMKYEFKVFEVSNWSDLFLF